MSAPSTVSTKITLKDDIGIEPTVESSESFETVRHEVPKLITQLKTLMGTDLHDNFAEMNPSQKQKALKDMEEAIKILTIEYKKAAGTESDS